MLTEVEDAVAGLAGSDSGVDADYRHIAKHVTSGITLATDGSVLKWYEVHPADLPVPADIAEKAHCYVSEARLGPQGFGFVILHRCARDFYFLIVSTWRNNNELWETVFYKNGNDMSGFAEFPRNEAHKPTFCVWELAPLWHEQQAWVRFLRSARDAAAAHAWERDRYSGQA